MWFESSWTQKTPGRQFAADCGAIKRYNVLKRERDLINRQMVRTFTTKIDSGTVPPSERILGDLLGRNCLARVDS
jgi:hypothetical protein